MKPRRSFFTWEPLAADVAAPTTLPQSQMLDVVLSPDQRAVFDAVMAWITAPKQPYLTLGGLAGTGKTTLVSVIARELPPASVAFAAFTGKAASVLSRKLASSGVSATATTLHSLLYRPYFVDGQLVDFVLREELPPTVKLVVVDEASMLNSALWQDLLSFRVPVLAVGDHGQLPPVGKDNPNLLAKPMLRLEQIHRQAQDNPIVALAHHIRAGGALSRFSTTDARVRRARSVVEGLNMCGGAEALRHRLLDTAVIVGRNATRVRVNAACRDFFGWGGEVPDVNEAVIALRNFPPVLNGLRGLFAQPVTYDVNAYGAFEASVVFPDDGFKITGRVNSKQFGAEKTFQAPADVGASNWTQAGLLFDYGYALTCHKFQGSQAQHVIVLAGDTFGDADTRKRWFYTAVTRASEKLILVGA